MASLLGTILSLFLLPESPSATPRQWDALSRESAVRLLALAPEEASANAAIWNDRRVIFVDWLAGPDGEAGRHVYVVYLGPGGRLRSAKVTIGEQEGADAEIAELGFMNADEDAADELVIILKWRRFHHHVYGDSYEVRLFDELKPNQVVLPVLDNLTRHFGGGCDCSWRDGRVERYRFKTIADVHKELSRLGY